MQINTTTMDVAPSPVTLLRRSDVPHPERALRTKQLVVVGRGVYASAEEWRGLRPWERYLARVHAAALRLPDAVFVLESAAALRGLPVFGEPADIHVAALPGATSRAVSGVRVHTARRLPSFDETGGLLVETPAEIAVDIARSRHHGIGLAVAGSVLRSGGELDAGALHELNRIRPSSRGRRHARWAIDRATGVPESTLEFLSLAVIEWLGFPMPALQKWILGATSSDDYRLDFWWEATATGGEADGDSKVEGRDAVAVLRERRARDAELIARGVSATAHWGWSDVTGVAPLRAALRAGGLRPERPEDIAELRSFARIFAQASPAPRSIPPYFARQQ